MVIKKEGEEIEEEHDCDVEDVFDGLSSMEED